MGFPSSNLGVTKDSKTHKILGVAKQHKGLHLLNSSSITNKIVPNVSEISIHNFFVNSGNKITSHDDKLWHHRPGHVFDLEVIPDVPHDTLITEQTIPIPPISQPDNITSIPALLIPLLFSATDMIFLANLAKVQDPHSFKQARLSQEWVKAMAVEIQVLEDNRTWTIVDLPEGVRPIGCKWVYKVKCKVDGTMDKYKARLVAKGYIQMRG
ncbi:hypothetical protein LIER_16169 [Lithospermum erythrorhizon]|uniref:Reverse transcriptase Ty1/copia-type domain-containing protein n=1 Tax=Lithospermum erythrorhizon TaxID=34254 RepID=A0AAV3Q8T9_LITER